MSEIFGNVEVQVAKEKGKAVPVTVLISAEQAEALGIEPGDSVDVDYFETIEALVEHYGSSIAVIAVTC